MNRLGIILAVLSLFLVMGIAGAFTVPSGYSIGNYVNISLNNLQAGPIKGGTQILLAVNTIAYNAYINSGANDIVVFNGITGTVLYQYTEGSTQNQLQTTSLNTINSLGIWVVIPGQIAGSTNAVNVISIGFPTSMNTFEPNGNTIGCAPYLNLCGGYGQYDNGNTVFNSYFNGNTNPSLFSLDSGGTYYMAQNTEEPYGSVAAINSLNFQGYSGSAIIAWVFNAMSIPNGNYIAESSYYFISTSKDTGVVGLTDAPTASTTTGNAVFTGAGFGGAQFIQAYCTTGSCTSDLNNQGSNLQQWLFGSLIYNVTSTGNFFSRTGVNLYTPTYNGQEPNKIPTGSSTFYLAGYQNGGSPNPGNILYNWMRVRLQPPGNTMPTETFGPVQSVSNSNTPSISLSNCPLNPTVDVGQTESCKATVSGGTGPYTYNIVVSNVISPSVILRQQIDSADSLSSNTFSFLVTSSSPPNDLTNSPETFNVFVTDAASNKANTIYSANFVINPALTTPTAPTPNTPSINSGQAITLTSTWTGGTPNYQAKWYSSTTSSCTTSSTLIATYSNIGTTTNSISVSPTSNTFYCLTISDSASQSAITSISSYDEVIVNPSFTGPTISPSTPSSIYLGSSITFSTTWTGGTPNYNAIWYVFNSLTNTILQTTVHNGISSMSDSVSFPDNAFTTGNAVQANVFITDSAFSPQTFNSVKSGVITLLGAQPTTNALLTFQLNPAPYLVHDLVTMTPNSPTDGSNIIINGSVVSASSSGVSTYDLFNINSIGTYHIYGCDTTIAICVGDPNVIDYIPVYVANYSNTVIALNPVYQPFQACGNNILGGSCSGNLIYTATNTLTNNVVVSGNLTINSGVTITTNGFNFYVSNIFTNLGVIITGHPNNGGANGGMGGNFLQSYGGSGGGAGNIGGGAGGNTLANGGQAASNENGASPTAPVVTNANIVLWSNSGFTPYFASAGGGSSAIGGFGGAGSFGLYIQASNIIAGTIDSNGLIGIAGGGGNSGGGGSAIVVLAYNSAYTAGTYNTLGGVGSGGSAGHGGAGNVITYNFGNSIPIPLNSVFDWYYPYSFTTNSPSPSFNFTLNQTFNGVLTTLTMNALNLIYIPPASQQGGPYQYGIIERQIGNSQTVGFNYTYITTNMEDISNSLSFNSPIIQDFPNLAYCPSFNIKPTSWEIVSDYPGNMHLNVSNPCSDWWSNNNVSFVPNMLMVYPIGSFYANVLNNPTLTTINQYPNNVVTLNTLPAAPYTRRILNVTVLNQSNFKSFLSQVTLNLVYNFNNYTIANSVGYNAYTYNSPSFNVYIGSLNNGQLPLVNTTLLADTVLNTSYLSYSNYACPQSIGATPYKFANYLVNGNLGAYYTVEVSTSFSAIANGDYLQVFKGLSSSSATKVQQIKIASTSFAIPLVTGAPYGFIIVGSKCQNVYSTNFSTWTSPIYITIPIVSNVTPIIVPVPQITCVRTSNSITLNSIITCTGNDKTDLVNSWTVQIYNLSSFQGPLVNASTLPGNYFTYSNSSLSNTVVYSAVVTWTTANGVTGTQNFQFNLNFVPGIDLAQDGLFVLIIELVCIGFGAGLAFTPGGSEHAISNTLFIMAFGIFICYMIGLSQSWGIFLNGALIIFLIFIGALSLHSENKSRYGGW